METKVVDMKEEDLGSRKPEDTGMRVRSRSSIILIN
jgi:hypothetical protein